MIAGAKLNKRKQIETEFLELLERATEKTEIVSFLNRWPILLPIWFPRDSRVYCDFELPGVGCVDFAYHRPDTTGELWRFIRIADPQIGLRDGGRPSDSLINELDELEKFRRRFVTLCETGKHTSPINSFRFVSHSPECYLVVGRRKETGYLDQVRHEDWSFISTENAGNITTVTFDFLLCCLDHLCWNNPSVIELVHFSEGLVKLKSEFLLKEERRLVL